LDEIIITRAREFFLPSRSRTEKGLTIYGLVDINIDNRLEFSVKAAIFNI